MAAKNLLKTAKKDTRKLKSFIEERPIESTILALAIGYMVGNIISNIKNIFK